VEPAICHTVPWRVTAGSALPEARLHVTFVDGTSGDGALRAFLCRPDITGTAFEALRDSEPLGGVAVALGAVTSLNGADLARDGIYDAIRERGCWTLD
jgi:hypothetical protein